MVLVCFTKGGPNFVRDYSGIPLDTVNLVRELRDNSLFVPGFLTSELNVFVHRCGFLFVRYKRHCCTELVSWEHAACPLSGIKKRLLVGG